MSSLSRDSVQAHMSSPVNVIADLETAAHAEGELRRHGVSAMPVIDRAGNLCGVISRTDLLRAGRVRLVNGHRRKILTLPEVSVRELMSPVVEIVAPEATLGDAARRMVRMHLHRLFVSNDRRPVGVVSTLDIMRGVARARIALPISELMQRSIVSVKASDPLSLAVDRMAVAHHSGVLVVEEGWPVGVFTQADALAARDAPPDDRVDYWMDTRVIMLPMAFPICRAAEQATATRAKRLLVVDGKGVSGVVTGIDFARLVAERADEPA